MKLMMKMKPDALLTSDWHIRADTPQCRTDDFLSAMWNKIIYITNLANKYDIPILLAGDLGQRSQWPNWLIEKFMEGISETKIIAIPGQHDLPEHNLELQPRSAYGILQRSEYINHGIEEVDQKFGLALFPYGVKIKKSNFKTIAITHQMVIEDKPEWPGQVASSGKALLKKFPGYRLILSGDNHKPFVVKYEGRLLVNPGSMMRTTADQIDHKPRVYLYETKTNSVEAVYLPIQQGVIDRSHIDTKKEKDARIEAYTARLSERYEIGLSFEANLEEHFKTNRTRKPVKERIWEACE
jgi:DNA repair exonuclease SbcCD nuclease subunit